MQVISQGRATKASDVFSFGVVMCEVCSKVTPYEKQGRSFAPNLNFPQFAPGTPSSYQELALR